MKVFQPGIVPAGGTGQCDDPVQSRKGRQCRLPGKSPIAQAKRRIADDGAEFDRKAAPIRWAFRQAARQQRGDGFELGKHGQVDFPCRVDGLVEDGAPIIGADKGQQPRMGEQLVRFVERSDPLGLRLLDFSADLRDQFGMQSADPAEPSQESGDIIMGYAGPALRHRERISQDRIGIEAGREEY